MARKPKPTALKVLAGTRSSRVNRSEPTPPKGQPDPPYYLDPAALDEWGRLAPMLASMGVLTPADGPALGVYCMAFSRWVKACQDINANGFEIVSDSGAVKKSPAAEVASQAEATMLKVLSEFGMTPSSRSRVTTNGEGPIDELGEFLKRRL